MIRRLSHIIFIIMVLIITGCIKETYDMDRLSGKVQLSPTIAVSVINGDLTLSDLVDSGDTIVFDENNLVKIVFREDSIIELEMSDFYDLNDMVSFNETYPVGELSLAPFYQTLNFSLDEISLNFPAPLRAQFVALDNTTNNFPPFPSTDLGENAFPLITNFENALFSSGTIEISIINNLPAPLNGVTIQLYNSVGHTPVGNEATISLINPGELGITSINLADEFLTNSIVAAIVITGSPGTSTPVSIDLNGSGIVVGIRGRDLKVKSGRMILPLQTIESLENTDTISFDPGTDIEIDELLITTGFLSYHVQSTSPVEAIVRIALPTALRSGVAITDSISVGPYAALDGTILVDNTMIDLGTDPLQPYNRVPLGYSIEISSDNQLVDFDWQDEISIDFSLLDPVFDYVKGYFGQQTESIDPESINLEIEDILSNISGDFLLSSPSIKLNYSNSFAIPMEIDLLATGKRGAETVNLDLAPVIITYPVAPGNRDVSATFAIDKSNSSLPELVSLPPEEIVFSGSARMNPSGNSGLMDNYVFGDSRFIGSLEVEVPVEFSMNLQFTDTLDNFLADVFEDDSDIDWNDIESLRVDFDVENGFPMGVSLSMDLYDSINLQVLSTVNANDLLIPAPVDADGKVTEGAIIRSTTSIELTDEFFGSIEMADKVILRFTLITTDNEVVKVYSDYRIDFNAALVMKPALNTYLK